MNSPIPKARDLICAWARFIKFQVKLFWEKHIMHQVEVIRNGVEVGKVRFRGIVLAAAPSTKSRRYQCNPKDCVPKGIVRKIADRLAFGMTAGHEEEYEWHT